MSSKLFFHHQLRGCQAGDELMLEEQEFGQLMYRYLQSSGKEYNVRFAYDGDEGWLSLCQQPPDPVMLDVIMPGQNGFEIIEEMKHNPSLSRTEVILVTGTHLRKN